MMRNNLTMGESSFFDEGKGGFDSADKIKAAKAVKAAGVLMHTMGTLANAAATKTALSSQINALSIYQNETDRRHRLQVSQLKKKAVSSLSNQKQAFIKGGVEMEGSALDVMGDTYYDLLEAELESEKERAFSEEQLRVKQAGLQVQRDNVDINAALSIGTTLIGGMM